MSNLIVPLQRLLLGSSSFVPANLRLEFTERVGNLCAYSGSPMTPALRSWVEDTFGLDMVRVIQDFSTYDTPKLSPSMRDIIKKVVPNTFDGRETYLEFVRLFDQGCCLNPICAVNQYPDPSECQLISFQTVDSTSFTFDIEVWNTDLLQWDVVAAVTGIITDGEAISYGDVTTTTGWTIFGNGVEVVAFDPTPSAVVAITFVNGNCTYEMPTVGTDCAELCTVDSIANLPDSNICTVAKVVEAGGDPKDVSIYKYIDGSWVQLYDITEVVQDGETTTSITFTVKSGYEISVDPDLLVWFRTSGTESVSVVGGITPRVRESATGCVWVADSIFYVNTAFLTDSDFQGFAGWTFIYGAFNSENLNTYLGIIYPSVIFKGSNTNRTGLNASSYMYVYISGNTTPPDFEIEDDLGNPITLNWENKWPICASTDFTVSDPALAVPISLISNSKSGWGVYTPQSNFADPNISSYLNNGRLTQLPGGVVIVSVLGTDVSIFITRLLFHPVMGLEVDDNGLIINPSFSITNCQ